MALTINTNMIASVAHAAVAQNSRQLGAAMEQLSTGKRINSAGDDAAGLAIVERMTSQIRGMAVAIANINDAISMISTADAALGEITEMLQRMRELAIQSGTGTSATQDRAYLDREYQALLAEITRIANNTQWNGRNVLDGTAAGYTNSVVAFNVSADVGGSSNRTITGEAVIHDMIIGRTQAEVIAEGWYTGTGTPTGVVGTTTRELVVHNDIIGQTPLLITAAGTWSGTGTPTGDALTTTTGEKVVHNDIIGNTQAQVAAAGSWSGTGTPTGPALTTTRELVVHNDIIGKTMAQVTAAGSWSGTGSPTGPAPTTTTGQKVNHDTIIGLTAAQISAWTVFTGTGFPTGPGGTYAVGDTFDGITLTAGQIEPSSYQVGDTFDGITLVAGSTETRTYANGDTFDGITLTTGQTELASYRAGDTFDGVTLVAGKVEKTDFYVAGDTFDGVTLVAGESENQSITTVDFGDLNTDMATLAATDIAAAATARSVITDIDAGIALVSERRASFGAALNRLTHSIDSITSASLATKASVSQIEDADYGIVSAELARTQIIQQAGMAMIAQANSAPNIVMMLLRG